MPIIFYKPEKEQPWARKGSITFNGVPLEPGTNALTDEQFKVLSGHPDYQKYVGWGAISPPNESLPLFPNTGVDINDFTPKEITPKEITPPPAKQPRKKPSPPAIETPNEQQ
jgi:hypothetical protein